MTPLEQLKHEARSMMFRAEQENDGPTVTRYAAHLAAVEALEADLESTRRALETEVAENTKLREALEPFAREARQWSTNIELYPDTTKVYAAGFNQHPEPALFTLGDLRRAALVLAETNARKEVDA